MPKHVTEVSCHSITGLRQFYNYMSSVTYCFTIGVFLATLCVHDILNFMFRFVFMFHIIFMFHEHIYTYCISYIFLVSCLLHMTFHILILIQEYLRIHTSFMYSCSYMNQLYLEIGIIPIGTSKLKLWHFHANQSVYRFYPRDSLKYSFSSALSP